MAIYEQNGTLLDCPDFRLSSIQTVAPGCIDFFGSFMLIQCTDASMSFSACADASCTPSNCAAEQTILKDECTSIPDSGSSSSSSSSESTVSTMQKFLGMSAPIFPQQRVYSRGSCGGPALTTELGDMCLYDVSSNTWSKAACDSDNQATITEFVGSDCMGIPVGTRNQSTECFTDGDASIRFLCAESSAASARSLALPLTVLLTALARLLM